MSWRRDDDDDGDDDDNDDVAWLVADVAGSLDVDEDSQGTTARRTTTTAAKQVVNCNQHSTGWKHANQSNSNGFETNKTCSLRAATGGADEVTKEEHGTKLIISQVVKSKTKTESYLNSSAERVGALRRQRPRRFTLTEPPTLTATTTTTPRDVGTLIETQTKTTTGPNCRQTFKAAPSSSTSSPAPPPQPQLVASVNQLNKFAVISLQQQQQQQLPAEILPPSAVEFTSTPTTSSSTHKLDTRLPLVSQPRQPHRRALICSLIGEDKCAAPRTSLAVNTNHSINQGAGKLSGQHADSIDTSEQLTGQLCRESQHQLISDKNQLDYINETNFEFWKSLSNLTKSITQRHQVVESFEASKGQPQAPTETNLAPEVVGYIEQKLRQINLDQFDKQNNNMTASTTYVAANNEPDKIIAPKSSQQHQQQLTRATKTDLMEANNQARAPAGLLASLQPDDSTTTTTSGLQPAGRAPNHLTQHNQIKLTVANPSNMISTTTTTTTTQRPTAAVTPTTTTKTTTVASDTPNTTSRSSVVSSLSSCILSDLSDTNDSDVVRLKWGKKMDFLLSIIGFAVDLANIWRFPYLVYKNGGGVFLIPYVTMLIFGGIPLFFLELCLGQFVKKGPITVWNKICPSMKGVGYCSILISCLTSFGQKMPWEDCDNSWNSKSGQCVSISHLKSICSSRTNETLEACRKSMFADVSVTSPASEFFVKELSQIDQSTGLDDMGFLRPELVACTMIVYLLHYFSLFRGLETSGKVVWVTATAPYVILSILLVRGLFLPGASMGIEYYLSPKLEKLADPQVWIDAAGQVFYSIGVGFGVHLTYASFNSHDNNCYRDCLMTSAVNALTSVYSGLVVFVYLGYMATNLGIEIDKVASEGYSLVFEVYPEALTTLPFARFWSILFFIMLLTLGIDSAMGGLEAVITGLEDEFKFVRRFSRGQLTGLVIFSSFLPALISCTQGGAYTLFWFDIYSAGVSLLFSALFETIGVVYCYGLDKFIVNIESMLGRRPHLFFILCWKYISPVFLIVVIFMSIYTASVPVYRGYSFPLWSIILGWCLAFSSVAAIPIVAVWTWLSSRGKTPIGSSPEKSPKKRASGLDSVASGHKKSPSAGQHYKSAAVNCNHRAKGIKATDGHYCGDSEGAVCFGSRGGTGGFGGRAGGSITATTILESSPSDHRHHYTTSIATDTMQTRISEDML